MKAIVTSVRLERDTDVAHVRRSARLAAKSADAAPRDQIRFATAVSEIARNALQYAGGGMVELAFDQKGNIPRLVARIQDRGGGIPDVEAILRGRHQSHTGLGLGLNGSQKLVDSFDLKTGEGGTIVTLGLHLSTARAPRDLAGDAAAALVDVAQGNPIEELAEQNRALRDSLAEQEFLLRELHHRTKNNLSIIQSLATLQARSAASAEAREALNVLTGRIQAFANAHSYLYRAENVAEIDLREHVLGLTDRLGAAFAANHVRIVCDVESVPIGFDMATELALIINELVTNAAKHAFGSETEDREIHVDVRRDGLGARRAGARQRAGPRKRGDRAAQLQVARLAHRRDERAQAQGDARGGRRAWARGAPFHPRLRRDGVARGAGRGSDRRARPSCHAAPVATPPHCHAAPLAMPAPLAILADGNKSALRHEGDDGTGSRESVDDRFRAITSQHGEVPDPSQRGDGPAASERAPERAARALRAVGAAPARLHRRGHPPQ